MRLRVCNVAGCPVVSEWSRCAGCRAASERERGNTTERGYGWRHQQVRRTWAQIVAAGKATCWRCGNRLDPLEDWDLGHLDDRSGYAGPECLPCNRATSRR